MNKQIEELAATYMETYAQYRKASPILKSVWEDAMVKARKPLEIAGIDIAALEHIVREMENINLEIDGKA